MKSYYLRFLGLILFLILFIPSVFAQPQNTTLLVRSGNSGNAIQFNPLIRDCGEPLEFDVYVANLELFLPEGDTHFSDGFYHLPNTMPNLYLELNVIGADNDYSITELTSFEFSHVVNGVNMYKAGVTIDLPAAVGNIIRWESRLLMINDNSGNENSQDPVNGNGDDVIGPNGETYQDEPVPGYLYYPIWNYRNAGDVFTCEAVLYWTDCYYDACPSYNDDNCWVPFPQYAGAVYCEGYIPPCNDCAPGEGLSQSTDLHNLQSDPIRMNTQDISVSPNPFDSAINIRLSTQSINEITVDIINLNGQVIESFEKSVWKGTNEMNLTVGAIPKGVYFIRISDGMQTHIQKMIKN